MVDVRKFFLKSPSYEEFLNLLMAWRVWLVGALVGGLLATAVYLAFPPPYRARATVLVDQNVEQVIVEEQSDLRYYTYLQRETDKLIVIAWSDATISSVAEQTGIPAANLRDGRLQLSQPSDGGWHFYADSPDPETAEALAAAWATAFSDQVRDRASGVSPIAEITATQVTDLPVARSLSMGVYVFCGALAGVALFGFVTLFVGKREG